MNAQIDFSSKTPYHVQAEHILRQMINTEKYRSGAILPNEVELAQELKISRNTLRQAINRLVNEGLLLRKKGWAPRSIRWAGPAATPATG